MDHTGIRILFEGSNGLRLLSGLWTTVEISLLSVIGSVIFGLLPVFHDTPEQSGKTYFPILPGVYPHHAAACPSLHRLFRHHESVRYQPVRICCLYHRFHLMGNGRNGRSRQRRAHLYP